MKYVSLFSGIEQDGASFTLNCTDRHGVLAFAQNARDEVRIVGDGTLSGALAANMWTSRTWRTRTIITCGIALIAGGRSRMISNDQRREVAKRLRGLEVCDYDGELYDVGEVEIELGLVSDDGAWYEADGVRKLADLIDRPTCRNIGDDYMFKCSECGAEFEPVTVNGNEYGEVFYTQLKPLYCAACGAEVVEDD